MNTPSHFLMTVAAAKLQKRWVIPFSAIAWGSIAPDIALYFLSFGGIAYYGYWLGWPAGQVGEKLFSDLFFHNPIWIALHNFLHSPVVLLSLLSLIWLRRDQSMFCQRTWANWSWWFLIACLFHSIVDIVTHYDDGPLLFWPLNWSYRFQSPVSYWDPAHYGGIFFPIELLMCLVLSGYLINEWWRKRRTDRTAQLLAEDSSL